MTTPHIVTWPFYVYSGEVGLTLVEQSRSVSQTLGGFAQVVGSGAQRWQFTMDANTLKPEWIPGYRAAIAKVRGRLGLFRIPIRDRFQPKPDANGLPGRTRLTHSSGVTFSSGAGYRRQGVPIMASCEVGATAFTADATTRAFLYPGMYFGLGEDLHIVKQVEDDQILFEPAARRKHSQRLISLRPTLIARMADDASGRIGLELGRWGRPSITLVEHVLT
jgi:hypothetical protein